MDTPVPRPIDEVSIFHVRRFVMRDQRIGSITLRAIVYEILNFDGFMEKETISVSKDRLAQELNCAWRTVDRAVKAAEELGYWKQEQKKGDNSRYQPTRFHIDWLQIRQWIRKLSSASPSDIQSLHRLTFSHAPSDIQSVPSDLRSEKEKDKDLREILRKEGVAVSGKPRHGSFLDDKGKTPSPAGQGQKEASSLAAALREYWGEDPEMEEFRRYQDLKQQQRRRALVSEEYQ